MFPCLHWLDGYIGIKPTIIIIELQWLYEFYYEPEKNKNKTKQKKQQNFIHNWIVRKMWGNPIMNERKQTNKQMTIQIRMWMYVSIMFLLLLSSMFQIMEMDNRNTNMKWKKSFIFETFFSFYFFIHSFNDSRWIVKFFFSFWKFEWWWLFFVLFLAQKFFFFFFNEMKMNHLQTNKSYEYVNQTKIIS